MAKKIRFPLIINDVEVRTLEDLRENFDLQNVMGYYTSGKLVTWLRNQYYDDEAAEVEALSPDDKELTNKLCCILGVNAGTDDDIDIDELKRRSEKLAILKQFTNDSMILDHPEYVALDQDDLYEILDMSPDVIYLVGETFEIPVSKNGIKYVGINAPKVRIRKKNFDFNFKSFGLCFVNVEFAGVDNAEDQFSLGKCYETGNGVTQDVELARKWYEKAAKNGHEEASEKLTLLDISGDEAEKNYLMGKRYHEGDGVAQSYEKAVEYYRKAAEQSHVEAQFIMGLYYYDDKKDKERALMWFEKAAEQGFPDAQYILGMCYDIGNGVKEDKERAFIWFKKAAEQGLADAQYALGKCYYNGYGVEEDKEEAFIWFKKAAEQGLADAQFNLGICYNRGYGVKEDKEEAFNWYKKAAEHGLADAQYFLGMCYDIGNGVKEDKEKAFTWFQRAADQGHEQAQIKLSKKSAAVNKMIRLLNKNIYVNNKRYDLLLYANKDIKSLDPGVLGSILDAVAPLSTKIVTVAAKKLTGKTMYNQKEVDHAIRAIKGYISTIAEEIEITQNNEVKSSFFETNAPLSFSYNFSTGVFNGYDPTAVVCVIAYWLKQAMMLEDELRDLNAKYER